MAETVITLIRHGQTTWNSEGRWQGHADVPLSEVGRAQAVLVARHLMAEEAHFDQIYASDLRRALETATTIADALGMTVHPLPALREVHLGVWSGLTTPEILDRYGDQFRAVSQGGKRGEHGESDAEFADRVTAALIDLADRHPGQHLLVVTHGGTIKSIVFNLIARVDTLPQTFANTSITTVAREDGTWRLLRLDDHQHLDGPVHTGHAL